jgi:hypothetical protein
MAIDLVLIVTIVLHMEDACYTRSAGTQANCSEDWRDHGFLTPIEQDSRHADGQRVEDQGTSSGRLLGRWFRAKSGA